MDLDGMSVVHRKCRFWRELLDEEDRFDSEVKPRDRRVHCSCFVEGLSWEVTVGTVPADCPLRSRCRYYAEA